MLYAAAVQLHVITLSY